MKDAYAKLMMQQHTSRSGDIAFEEKLEKAGKKNFPIWKAAIVVACVLLMVPVTVWAAESIFTVSKVTVCERPIPEENLPGIGLDIVYEKIENHGLRNFPRHLQSLEEGELLLHTSQEEVEDYLGLDLLENTVLSAEDTHPVGAFDEPGKNYQTYCGVWDGQLLFTEVQSVYKRNGIRFKVTATATVAHPTADGNEYHSTSITYLDEHNRKILSEQYVTQAGIPVLIVSVTEDSHLRDDSRALVDYFACFAVNNISYKIELSGWFFDSYDKDSYASPDEKVTQTLAEVLDGYILE